MHDLLFSISHLDVDKVTVKIGICRYGGIRLLFLEKRGSMSEYGVPHLCGGILFNLMLETRKPRTKKRDRMDNGTDNLSNVDVYSGLVYIITGEHLSDYSGGSIRKCVSKFRSCDNSSGVYIPFTDIGIINAFLSQMKTNKEQVYKRINEFKEDFLNEPKCEWLVRAIVDIIRNDKSILRDYLFEVKNDIYVTKMEIHNTVDFSFPVFIGSVLGYVMEFCPDCESGKETFLEWYSRNGERSEWKYVGNVGNGLAPINVVFDFSSTDIVENVVVERHGGYEERENAIRIQQEQFDEETILEAQRFCLKYEDEIDLLPLCQIAYNVNPIHKNVRQMYTDYILSSSEVKRKILQFKDIPEFNFNEDWIDNCVKRYDEEIKARGLSTKNFLYEGGKYLHRAFERYSDYKIKEFNPWIFDRPYKVGFNNNLTTLGYYIIDFFWYKETDPGHYVEPPMDYLWDLCDLGNCPEFDMTYWVCLFIIMSSYQIVSDNYPVDERWENVSISDELIKTQEDMYYYALLQLYWLYEIDRAE